MADREWMYTGFKDKTNEWVNGTGEFLEKAFGLASKGAIRVFCPCSKCKNQTRKEQRQMRNHIWANGYVPNYTRWILHGEPQQVTEAVVRPDLEGFDQDAGMANLLEDVGAVEGLGVVEEDPESTAKAYYDMMEATKEHLHEKTRISKLDAISRLIGLKSSLGISREGFDLVLATVGGLLPEEHCLPKNTTESQKLLRALKMPYNPIQACKNGCVLFRGDHEAATHCPECKASRYMEVEGSDGTKKQSKIPEMVIRHLPVLPRLQRLYMTEESAKQMTWH
jgi:hypothetical protein